MSDLDRLIRFAAVAEELSFSRAAAKLHVEAPWLSQQIQQLETQIGAPLFVRDTRRVELTPLGCAVLGPASRLARAAEEARGALQRLSKEYAASLAIGVTVSSFWLPARQALLRQMAQSYPNVAIQLISGSSGPLCDDLRAGMLDCAIVFGRPAERDLESVELFRGAASVLIPAENPLARRKVLRLKDLSGQALAVNRRALAPAGGDAIYDPFLQAEVRPVLISEGRQAMLYEATAKRLILVSIGWPHSDEDIGSDFVNREVADCPLNIEYVLVRRREAMRRPLEKLWMLAGGMAAEAQQ
jgi:DNA-binding transcriptional LysR family regulator